MGHKLQASQSLEPLAVRPEKSMAALPPSRRILDTTRSKIGCFLCPLLFHKDVSVGLVDKITMNGQRIGMIWYINKCMDEFCYK